MIERESCSAMSGPGVTISTIEASAKVRMVVSGGMKLGMRRLGRFTASLHGRARLTIGGGKFHAGQRPGNRAFQGRRQNEQRHQENRPLLFRQPRYLDH